MQRGLVIELDGGQHFSDESEQADAARSAVIEARASRCCASIIMT